MSDIIDLLAAQLLKDNASTNNPYAGAAAGIDSMLGTIPQYNMKPWEALLAGALGGFASGALKGYGESSQNKKTSEITQKLLAAFDAQGGIDTSVIAQTPEIAKYAPLIELNDLQEKNEEQKALRKLTTELAAKGPKMLTMQEGMDSVTYAQDPLSGTLTEVARGPKFKPSASPGEANQKLLDALVNSGNLDPSIAGAVDSQRDLETALRAIGQAGLQNRFNTNKTVERRKSSLFGYEPLDQSFMLQPSELDDLRNKVGSTQEVISKLETLAGQDLTQIAGRDSATQQATAAMMFQAFRNKTGSGANLTKNEESLIKAMMPKLAAGDLVGAITAGALGRDQNQFSKDLQVLLQEGLDIDLFSRGLRRKSRDVSTYPQKLRETMGLYETQPSADRVAADSAVKTAPPGMSFEQFQAWKKANK